LANGKEVPMARSFWKRRLGRRRFLKESAAAGLLLSLPWGRTEAAQAQPRYLYRLAKNNLYWVKNIPNRPFTGLNPNDHAGVHALLRLMGQHTLKFYRSDMGGPLSGPHGLINADDVVLIKVNAQWKYRGCTNSDVIRGLIHKILDHPDGFSGEVVIFDNGQGWGSLDCDSNPWSFYGRDDTTQHANANDESHSFRYLVDTVFGDSRVSAFLMDDILLPDDLPMGDGVGTDTEVESDDHTTNGYRRWENVSYPCFTTAGGHRVELREGLWTGTEYSQNLKLINVPVLKDHFYTSFTCSLKNTYGILSMPDLLEEWDLFNDMHNVDPGQYFGMMMVSIKTPVLNIVDAIWVSQGDPLFTWPGGVPGYPPEFTTRTNQLLASQDPVALDYWATKHILYPIDNNPRHHPVDNPGIDAWLTSARETINDRGGLYDPDNAIYVRRVTKNEVGMAVHISNMAPRLCPLFKG
jgi:hypothetical protein